MTKSGVGKLAILLVLLGAALYWFWPASPEHIIKKQLVEVAKLASFGANEAPLAKLSNSQKLTLHFANELEILIDVPGRAHQQVFHTHDELLQAAMGARSTLGSLQVEFLDINVIVGPDKASAVADLTARIFIAGDKDFIVQEMKFSLRKIDGEWLIYRVETVKTLS
jgi:hypothetical protein